MGDENTAEIGAYCYITYCYSEQIGSILKFELWDRKSAAASPLRLSYSSTNTAQTTNRPWDKVESQVESKRILSP